MNLRDRLEATYARQLDSLFSRPQFREQFLPRLTSAEESALARQFVPLAVSAALWCRSSSILDARIVAPLALITIAPFPESPLPALLKRMKGAIWFYAVDDMIDRPGRTFRPMVSAINDAIRVSVAKPGEERPRTIYGQILTRMKADLRGYDTFSALGAYWSLSLARTLDAMVFEYWTNNRFRSGNSGLLLPSMEEYLYFGRHSIVNAHLMMTALIVENDASLVPVAGQLMDLATQCGGPIRLANDLASFGRERDEQKFNSVILAGMDGNGGIPFSKDDELGTATVLRRLRQERRVAYSVAEEIRSHGEIGSKFLRSMDLCVDLYFLGDYRLWERDIQGKDETSLAV